MQMRERKKKNRHIGFTSGGDACMSWLRVRCALQSAPSLNDDQGVGARWTAFFRTGWMRQTKIFPPPPLLTIFRQTDGILCDL